MAEKSELQRVAFSPGEFAALFGKSQTWGYRQLYSGKVTAINEFGRLQIPASEVERILATAARYLGMPAKPTKTKSELQSMKPELQSAWRLFVRRKRDGNGNRKNKADSSPSPHLDVPRPNARDAALRRLTRRKF